MKRLLMAALATMSFAAPLALPAEAAAQHQGRGHNRHDYDNRDDRRDERRAYRHGRQDQRHWDHRRYNGYWYDGRFYYGPPPAHWNRDVRYDYRAWRRGDRLPRYYADRYRPVDYRYYRLRQPPRGYHYVYDDDREEYLLVGIATGVILGVILAGS